MNFELRHFDTPLLRFSADGGTTQLRILWVNGEKSSLLPLGLRLSDEGLAEWLAERVISQNRMFAYEFLETLGLDIDRPLDIIRVSRGLSLNDCFWVVEEGFDGVFDSCDLYDNRFSRELAVTAFTGKGSPSRPSFASCPEFTTDGMLPKCWRRVNGKITLYKGGTSGASNTGNEPYSEFYAPQIAEQMGINAIGYDLSEWSGMLCSTCELFTSRKLSFVPVGSVVTQGGMEAVREYYEKLGAGFVKALDDMLVFDALAVNTDRHFGNFGFLVDNAENVIAAPAPLFDNGSSLLSLAGRAALSSYESFEAYADTLPPCAYDDFIGMAKAVLTREHREKLRTLLSFRFRRHPRYNLPSARLEMLERLIQKRAALLLE